MARARNIKPGLFKNEILGEADPIYTLLFAGLWTLADKEGRLEFRPKRIKAELFPYRFDLDLITALDWLNHESFITVYEFEGKKYIQVNNWKRHQTPHHKEVESEIPSPESAQKVSAKHEDTQERGKHESSMNQDQAKENASCSTDSLNRIPDSLNPSFDPEPSGEDTGAGSKKPVKFTDDDYRFAEGMAKAVQRVSPKLKPPNLDTWADVIRLMREQDGLTHQEIAAVFRWANQDGFWSPNILSPGKLREKFAQLDAKMRSESNGNPSNRPTAADKWRIDHEDTSWLTGYAEGPGDSFTGESDIQGVAGTVHRLETHGRG